MTYPSNTNCSYMWRIRLAQTTGCDCEMHFGLVLTNWGCSACYLWATCQLSFLIDDQCPLHSPSVSHWSLTLWQEAPRWPRLCRFHITPQSKKTRKKKISCNWLKELEEMAVESYEFNRGILEEPSDDIYIWRLDCLSSWRGVICEFLMCLIRAKFQLVRWGWENNFSSPVNDRCQLTFIGILQV